MKISKIFLVAGLLVAISLAACAQPQNAQVPNTGQATQTPVAMMDTPTVDAMMNKTPDAMMGTPTVDAMMEKTPDAMMGTPTVDAMMEKTPDAMMGTPTGDAMKSGTPDAMMGTPTGSAMMATPTGEMMQTGTPGAMMEPPAWFSAGLVDARTGKSFSINDFKGKVVVVQNVAAQCAPCKEQDKQLQDLVKMAGSEVIVVGLDGDTRDNTAALKTYVEQNSFDGNYAIAPKAVVDAVNNLYGAQFFNASMASVLIIDKHGEAHPLKAGVMSADQLKKDIEKYTGM